MCVYISIYIYIYIVREREIHTHAYTCVYIYIYTHIYNVRVFVVCVIGQDPCVMCASEGGGHMPRLLHTLREGTRVCEKTFLLHQPWQCNTAAKTALQPLN